MVSTLIFALGISILLHAGFFAVAALLKTDAFTDFTYGAAFIVLVMYAAAQSQIFLYPQMILVALVVLWAVRLIAYLVVRIRKIKKDNRFDGVREDWRKFIVFWSFQAGAVWIILLPSLYFLQAKVFEIKLLSYLGVTVWFIGLTIESVADWQKFTFKNNPVNKGKFIATGLWKYARHPNYFGEMLVWWGIFLYVLPHVSGWGYITVIGPVFITYLLRFVTGVPPLEKRYAEKYAGNQEYAEYKKSTNLLMPVKL